MKIHRSLVLWMLGGTAFTAFPSLADVTVQDTWAESGRMAIQGTDWTVECRRDQPGAVLSSGGQSVAVIPFSENNIEADGVKTCTQIQPGNRHEAQVDMLFSAQDREIKAQFFMTDSGTLRITPAENMGGLAVRGAMALGILPGLRMEDVLYTPAKLEKAGLEPGKDIHVPAENWFAGLLEGGNGIVACAWPEGKQLLTVHRDQNDFTAIRLEMAGKQAYLELLAAPAIWHREELQRSFLEKNVEVQWKRPFVATYKTQLPIRAETTALRTFLFQKKPNEQYRPEVGSVAWPVWFDGERPMMRLSKKIPPVGEAVFYPMKDHAKSLMGFLNRTPVANLIEAQNARCELPQAPRNAANVGFVACGGTKVIRSTIFALGLQHREKEFLSEYADFLGDYVAVIQKRNQNFLALPEQIRSQIDAWANVPDLAPEARVYLDKMRERAGTVADGLKQKMDMGFGNTPEQLMARADQGVQRLKELLATDGPELFAECDDIVDLCNRLAWGHAEVMGMRFSMLVRDWAQECAIECMNVPAAVTYAQQLRAALRAALNGAPPW